MGNLEWSLAWTASIFEWDVISLIFSFVFIFFIGLYHKRRTEEINRVEKIRDMVWQFYSQSGKYWKLDANDPKIVDLETDMRQLSTRIGVEISDLGSVWFFPAFRSENKLAKLRAEALVELRRAGMGPPFEEKSRKPCPTRVPEILKEVNRLDELIKENRIF